MTGSSYHADQQGPRDGRDGTGSPQFPGSGAGEQLAAHIRAMIKQIGMTLDQLADQLGDTSSTSLSAYQRGDRPPPRDLLLKLITKAGQTRRQSALFDLLNRAEREREQVHNDATPDQPAVQPITAVPIAERLPCTHSRPARRRWAILLGAGVVLIAVSVLAGLFLLNFQWNSGQQPSSGAGGGVECYTIVHKDVNLRDYYSKSIDNKKLIRGQTVKVVGAHPTNPDLVQIKSEMGTHYIFRKYLGEPGCS